MLVLKNITPTLSGQTRGWKSEHDPMFSMFFGINSVKEKHQTSTKKHPIALVLHVCN